MPDWAIIVSVFCIATVVLAISTGALYLDRIQPAREKYIRSYVFPFVIFDKLRQKYPQLTTKDFQLVARALRQFFLGHLNYKRKFVGMPSRVTDDLWHEFILHTQEYNRFCQQAFGQYFHHVPAGVLGNNPKEDDGLRLTWRNACLEENINPKKPTRLPLLFAIDEKLKIAGGFNYTLGQIEQKHQQKSSGGCGGGCGGS